MSSPSSPQWPLRPDRQPIKRRPVPSRPTGIEYTSFAGEHQQPSRPDGLGARETNPPPAANLTQPFVSGKDHGSGMYKRISTDDEGSSSHSINKYRKHNSAVSTILNDCVAVILPVAILVFVALVWRLNGTRIHEGELGKWHNAITVLATLFPILFALIIGRLMSEAARWKLENGASLGSLEQLMGSRTVGSTVYTLIQFRAVNFLSLLLLAIWAFSPLGAQAFLRMLTFRPDAEYEPTEITYFDSRGASPLATMPIASTASIVNRANAVFLGYLATLYTAFVATPESIQLNSMDLWGNVKIPILESTTNDWQTVSQNANNVHYSSLTGVPLNYTNTGNTTFSIESNYIHLGCSNITKYNDRDPTGRLANMTGSFFANSKTFSDSILKKRNGTWRGYQNNLNDTAGLTTWGVALDRFVDPYWYNQTALDDRMQEKLGMFYDYRFRDGLDVFINETDIEVGTTNLLLQINIPKQGRDPSVKIEVTCGVTQKYVESRVTCSRTSTSNQNTCEVVAQRPSQEQHPPERISHLSFPRIFYYVSKEMPLATGRSLGGFADFSLQYLKDPTFKDVATDPGAAALEELDERMVGIRFGQLLNTYLILSQLSLKVTTGSFSPATTFDPNVTISADTSRRVDLYEVSQGWISVCLLSGLVLLTGGILSVVFAHLAHGPEILGYVSATIRDSKFIDLPPNSGWLGGSQLTKSMKKQRLRHGFQQRTLNGEPLVGVGYQDDTERFKDFAARG